MLIRNSFSLGLAAQTEVITTRVTLAFTDYSSCCMSKCRHTYEVDKMLVECEIEIEMLWKRPRPRHRTFFL